MKRGAGRKPSARPVSEARDRKRQSSQQVQNHDPRPSKNGPQQRTVNNEGLLLESSEDFATRTSGCASMRANARGNAGDAGAIDTVLQACSTASSAEQSMESMYHGPQEQSRFLQASDMTQYTNVMFQLQNSADEPTLEAESSVPALNISRTIAGSLCIPYEPHAAADTDPDSSTRGTGTMTGSTISIATKPVSGSVAHRSCKGLSWTDGTLAAEDSWATVAREESMYQLVEGDTVASPPKAERSRPSATGKHSESGAQAAGQHGGHGLTASGMTRQQRVSHGRVRRAVQRDWTRSPSRVASVQAEQESTAVLRYQRRMQQMYGAYLLSHSSAAQAQMVPSATVGMPTAHMRRVRKRFWPPDRSSLEANCGSTLESRSNASCSGVVPVDPPMALGMATNPIMSIMNTQVNMQNADAGEPLKLPDGTCLLSPFCMLAEATIAKNKPERDTEDLPIFDVVLGMSTSHPLRRVLIAVTLHWTFDTLMTLAIVVSCGSMVFERPSLPEGSIMAQYLETSNLVLTTIFGTTVTTCC